MQARLSKGSTLIRPVSGAICMAYGKWELSAVEVVEKSEGLESTKAQVSKWWVPGSSDFCCVHIVLRAAATSRKGSDMELSYESWCSGFAIDVNAVLAAFSGIALDMISC